MKNSQLLFVLLSFLTLLNPGCKQDQPDWSGTITFKDPGPRTLAADGYDTVKMTAHIRSDSDPDKRAIVFSTDYGTFTNGTNTITINADQNGDAVTAIKGTALGTATVRATVQTSFSALKTVVFVAPNVSQVFTVNPITDNLPADGVTTIAIGAVINKSLLYTAQSVVFTSDGGTFGNASATNTITADPNGNVVAYLKSSTAGIFHISLANSGVVQNVPVTFIKAQPDYLLLTANASLASGYANSLTIGIAAKRNIGTPGPGYLYNYTATDNSGNGIGLFTNGTASDASGSSSVVFTTGNSTYKGPVTITVSLQSSPATKTSFIVQII